MSVMSNYTAPCTKRYNPRDNWSTYIYTQGAYKERWKANPYLLVGQKAKVMKSKQKASYSFGKIVSDLEPYSLYPRNEIVWLLNLFCFFVFYHAKAGKLVKIPFLGNFFTTKDMYAEPYASKYSDFGMIDGNVKLSLSACAFAQWGLNPEQYTPYVYQKIPSFFKTFEAFRREAIHTNNIDWDLVFPDAKFLVFALNKLKHNGTLGTYASVCNSVVKPKPSSMRPKPKKVVGKVYGLDPT